MQKLRQQKIDQVLLDNDNEFATSKKMESSRTKSQLSSNKPHQSLSGTQVKKGSWITSIRFLLLITYFSLNAFGIVTTQLAGVPLYLINRNYYYAYMALTKRSFGVFVTYLTQMWAPTVVRISGDSSVSEQLRKTSGGRVEFNFPDRLVMVANHQLYSDWLYLWWVAYANRPKMHGHIYIILKESLKHIPVLGWGMRFYGFIFMSRKLAIDEPRLTYRLKKLKNVNFGLFSGEKGLDPMWLLLFPEGTNASIDGRIKSAAWAKKIGVKDMEHTLLPRSSGSFSCLNEVKGTVEYLYDCTLVYEGVKHGEFGQDNHTLRTMYILGQPPPSVNMYWRRFAISDIPLDDKDKFDEWLRLRWIEKDALIEQYITTGRFPPFIPTEKDSLNSQKKVDAFIETYVKVENFWDLFYILVPVLIFTGAIKLFIVGWNSEFIFKVFMRIMP